MARTTVKQPQPPNFDAAFGDDFSVKDYSEKEWKSVYYAIRELQGRALRKSKLAQGDVFSWDAYKAKFAEVFGTPQDKRFTLEQLVSYATKKWGMDLEQLKAYNRRSWERRNVEAKVSVIPSSVKTPQPLKDVSSWEVSDFVTDTWATDDIPY
ncbi:MULTISPECIES: hypothetical protein [unclassified Microcoleus]|uniref:hypothetical protein n=1 Tax=unclassified Microcoleus TaxID=2642155 RepID=UPI002FD4362D